MPQQPLSRRHFVAGAGALGAATIFAPQALGARGRRAPTLRGGSFRQGVLSGDPTPDGITLWTKVDGVGGRGSVELEVARDRGFRRVVARKLIPTSGSIDHAVKARVGGLKAHEQYYYRFSTRGEQPGRALPHRAAAGLAPAGQVRLLLLPGLHVRLLQRPPAAGARGHRLRGQPRRLHLRRGLPRRPAPSGGVRIDPIGEATTLADYRAKYHLYRSDSACARCTPSSR